MNGGVVKKTLSRLRVNENGSESDFWLAKPKRFDFMTLAILIPVIASAIGLFLMAIESFVFVQFGSLSNAYPQLRSVVALLSGFFMAFGGEVGTVANNTEIFSKYIKSRLPTTRKEWDIVTQWDWVGFAVSWLSTTLSVTIASSTREIVVTSWQGIISEWLVIPLMIIAVGDVVFGTIELGFRFGAFDARMVNWIEMRKQAQKDIDYLKSLETQQEDVEDVTLCWCGHELKSDLGYNRHQIVHRDEARAANGVMDIKDEWETRYADTITTADIPFPSIKQIAEWRNKDV